MIGTSSDLDRVNSKALECRVVDLPNKGTSVLPIRNEKSRRSKHESGRKKTLRKGSRIISKLDLENIDRVVGDVVLEYTMSICEKRQVNTPAFLLVPEYITKTRSSSWDVVKTLLLIYLKYRNKMMYFRKQVPAITTLLSTIDTDIMLFSVVERSIEQLVSSLLDISITARNIIVDLSMNSANMKKINQDVSFIANGHYFTRGWNRLHEMVIYDADQEHMILPKKTTTITFPDIVEKLLNTRRLQTQRRVGSAVPPTFTPTR